MKLQDTKNKLSKLGIGLRPILFSMPMVQAIVNGNKTQTRREVKPQPIFPKTNSFIENDGNWGWCMKHCCNNSPLRYEVTSMFKFPYGKPGDIIWVRETWNQNRNEFYYKASPITLPENIKHGIADGDFSFSDCEWKPSIHMPFEAARIFLRIKDVRVERLNEISEDDAKAEGIDRINVAGMMQITEYQDYMSTDKSFPIAGNSFMSLWESIYGFDSLKANPWVWVIEFERISLSDIYV